MSIITIDSYRNATETITIEWPDHPPSITQYKKGAQNGKIIVVVNNPAWPAITPDEIAFAIDKNYCLIKSGIESYKIAKTQTPPLLDSTKQLLALKPLIDFEFNLVARLVGWLRYSSIRIAHDV